MKDLNCDTIDSAMRMIEGLAGSMGLEVKAWTRSANHQ